MNRDERFSHEANLTSELGLQFFHELSSGNGKANKKSEREAYGLLRVLLVASIPESLSSELCLLLLIKEQYDCLTCPPIRP